MPQPFTPLKLIFGLEGLDLQSALDFVSPNAARRLTNLTRLETGGITARPGLTSITTLLTAPHSIVRLNDPTLTLFSDDGLRPRGVRIIGVESTLRMVNGVGGGATVTTVDTGYSGSPLTFLPYRPTNSGTPWLYISDTTQMRKVRPLTPTTALALPLGLPPAVNIDALFGLEELPIIPAVASLSLRDKARLAVGGEFDYIEGMISRLVVLGALRRTIIDLCEVTTGWVANTGTGGGAPTIATNLTDKKEGAASLQVTTVAPGAAGGYYSFVSKAIDLDLTRLEAGSYQATDDDQIHAWVKLDRPDRVDEVRLYFVLGAAGSFSTSTVPGASTTLNTDFYALAFRPSEFAAWAEVGSTQIAAAAAANTATQTYQQSTTAGPQLGPGRGVWTEVGGRGPAALIQVRRGAFKRYGGDTTLDWSDVRGVVVLIKTNTNQVVVLQLDDIYLHGGSGLDSSTPGNAKYNWRYRHRDPRTGAKGNPCLVQPEDLWIDVVRGVVSIYPRPFGDPEVVQDFFRQGGALVRNWYYVGSNSVDGGVFADDRSDNALLRAELLEFDNDQPVTTIDGQGITVLAQPLPVIFGPFDDVIFGLGDPYRRGNVYWCKRGEPDHWPPGNTRELCGSSEELITGCSWQNQPFCWSNLRGFMLLPSIASGTVDYVPIGATRGPVSRFAFAVCSQGMVFVAKDGVFLSAGGPEQDLTTERLRPLFEGRETEGYPAIDLTAAGLDAIRLAVHTRSGQDELWLSYVKYFTLIYTFTDRQWRVFTWQQDITAAYSEPTTSPSLLLGGGSDLYQHAGATDDGAAITCVYRSGALNAGDPRRLKELGDVWVQADRRGGTFDARVLLDDGSTDLGTITLSTGSGKTGYVVDPYGAPGGTFGGVLGGTRLAANAQLELSFTTSSATPPILYQGELTFSPHPESTVGRVSSEWDAAGSMSEKLVKGVLIECDTAGLAKGLDVEADGAVQTSITATAAGRQTLQFSWAQFRGKRVRIHPSDSTPWVLYTVQWIFDQEPLELTRWETQELTLGVDGWSIVPFMDLCVRGTGQGTLVVTTYGEDGTLLATPAPTPSTLTLGAKRVIRVGLTAAKGVLWKFAITGAAAVQVYRGESRVYVQAWDGSQGGWVKPFGNDDRDAARDMGISALAAATPGGQES